MKHATSASRSARREVLRRVGTAAMTSATRRPRLSPLGILCRVKSFHVKEPPLHSASTFIALQPTPFVYK